MLANHAVFMAVGTAMLTVAAPAPAQHRGAVSIEGDREPAAAPRTTWKWVQPVRPPLSGSIPAAAGALAPLFLSTNDDPEGDMPREVTFSADGAEVVVVNRDTDTVTFLDVDTRTVMHTVAVGDFPVHVAVSPDNSVAVVPNVLDHTVSIIDMATHTVTATVPVTGAQPYRVAITSDSAFAIVGVINDGVTSSMSVIDLDTATETLTYQTTSQGVFGFFATPESGIFGNIFTEFALAPDDSVLVLPDRGNDMVMLYDPLTGTELDALAVADLPTAVDVSGDSSIAVVSHEGAAQTVTVIDLPALAVADAHAVGVNLSNQVIRVTPDKSHAIAAISNNAVFVNLSSGAVTATLSTGTVGDVEISFDGQYAFVSNFNSRVIDISAQTVVATLSLAASAEAAASPTELRAVALNNRFREDVHFYNINGGSGFVEGFELSGAAPEGDATRNLAISADGRTLLACNNTSRNVSIIDLTSQVVRSYVDVGERPLDAAITPDGKTAVVCATDANAVVIIDLCTDTVVASLPIFNRPARVRISPDSLFAYVLNVAGTDQISFIDLDGADSSIVAQVSAGQTGSALGYSYTEFSGIELSPDGSVLAVCDSFNDFLRLYDTAAMTEVAAVPVGDFPIRVAFSADGSTAYVANSFGDSLSVVEVAGAASIVVGTVPAIEFPLVIETDGDWVYVGNFDISDPRLHVISTKLNTEIGFVPLSTRARASHLTGSTLVLAGVGSELILLDAAGPATLVSDTAPLAGGPSDMVFNDDRQVAVTAQPGPDGVDITFLADPPCLGDTDNDGDVDVDDLTAVILLYTQCGVSADVNNDGIVNVDDLVLVILNWGTC